MWRGPCPPVEAADGTAFFPSFGGGGGGGAFLTPGCGGGGGGAAGRFAANIYDNLVRGWMEERERRPVVLLRTHTIFACAGWKKEREKRDEVEEAKGKWCDRALGYERHRRAPSHISVDPGTGLEKH
jgi:hypothetical protein